jgi:ribonuclease P protein component
MEGSRPYSLGKDDRLKSRKQIESLFKSGKKITLFPFRLLYSIETVQEKIKAGFTVSSKNFPRAVDRNRIKRLSREAYRVQNTALKTTFSLKRQVIYLFFIYTGREILSYEEISLSVKQILEKLVRISHEENSANT